MPRERSLTNSTHPWADFLLALKAKEENRENYFTSFIEECHSEHMQLAVTLQLIPVFLYTNKDRKAASLYN